MKTKEKKKTDNHQIPEPTLRRLPGYLSYFKVLHSSGVKYVSSSLISNTFKMDATLVTKDLSYTGIKGKTKVGYEVETLISSIIKFLEFNTQEKAFIFGIGNLGKALIKYEGLKNYGLQIVAGFDIDPSVTGQTLNDVKIYPIDEFRDLSKKVKVRMGIITTPDHKAQEVADLMIAWGIKAIWNFTPQSIKVPDDIIVENTSIYSDLAVIINRLNINVLKQQA